MATDARNVAYQERRTNISYTRMLWMMSPHATRAAEECLKLVQEKSDGNFIPDEMLEYMVVLGTSNLKRNAKVSPSIVAHAAYNTYVQNIEWPEDMNRQDDPYEDLE